jgi:hypothetical protein
MAQEESPTRRRNLVTKQRNEKLELKKRHWFALSLDGWAVTLALIASLLVWAGVIKRIGW